MSTGVLAAWGTSPDVGTGDWRDAARCLETDPELFWPIGDTQVPGPSRDQADEAKTWCARCDVWAECREFALAGGETVGVWGGMTGAELVALRRKQTRARAAGSPPPAQVPPLVAQKPGPTVPAEMVLAVIVACREQRMTWPLIAELLGTSESTCHDVHRGVRRSVARPLGEKARAVAELVGV